MGTIRSMPHAGESPYCYRLICQVDPGGSRKAESFVAGTLEEVHHALLADLASGEGAYHALFYGETIVLQCWEGTHKVATLDLHPRITYRIAGLDAPIALGPGDSAPLTMDDDELMEQIATSAIEFTVTIDWASLPVPALQGRPLRPGETFTLEHGTTWAHGFHAHWDDKIAL